MTYEQALDNLYSQLPMFQRIGAAAFKKDLTNTLALCELLGNPHKKFKSIHIAGTNGKGSVSHLLAAILQSAGYKTGIYTSPHYKDFRERIKVNNKLIKREDVVNFVRQYQGEYSRIKPSFFEITVAMAFQHFEKENVDFAVVETGLGGRFDSTNVITPILSVITNIGYDHMQFLGNTLPSIAMEKAGIIKPHIPVVIGETNYETAPVFINTAKQNHSPIEFADQHVRMALRSKNPNNMAFDIYEHEELVHKNVKIDLYGNFQLKNLATTWCAIKVLSEHGIRIPESNIIHGIRNVRSKTKLLGRWQFLNPNKPLVVCDTGHNAAGIEASLLELNDLEHEALHFVLGFVNDKDLNSILTLFPSRAEYYFCKPDIPRGLGAEELMRKAGAFGLRGQAYSSVSMAYNEAVAKAGKNDIVFIGGSTFVVAEVL